MNNFRSKIVIIGIFVVAAVLLLIRGCWTRIPLLPQERYQNARAIPKSDTKVNAPSAVTAEEDTRFRALFAAPITFFGKIVDQYGHPIVGASVDIRVNDKPIGESSRYSKVSDGGGNFSIKGISGLTLYVGVSKDGYYRVVPRNGLPGSYGGFAFGLDQGNGIHVPNPSKPVVFKLHKQGVGEPVIVQAERRPRVPKNGSVVRLSLDPTTSNNIHFVEVQCWTDDAKPDSAGHFDWRFKVSVPHGALFERDDEFAFEAPSDGYRKSDQCDMPKYLKGRNWSDTYERDYFVKFDDNVFARVHVRMGAFGAHYVVYRSVLNPRSGSRSLEDAPQSK